MPPLVTHRPFTDLTTHKNASLTRGCRSGELFTRAVAESDDESTIISTLEQHLGIRAPEGRSIEHRRDEVFRSVYRTSLLQLLYGR